MFSGLMNEEEYKKFCGMKFGGLFHNKSYWGYKTSVLKSGICKYYRREIFDKFEWCVIEMLLLGLMSKAIMTNLLNRLSILLMEEIVCSEKSIIYNCILILNKLEKSDNNLEKIYLIKKFCNLVVKAKRGRLCSYMTSWWGNRSMSEKEEFEKEIEEVDIIQMKEKNLIEKGDNERLIRLGELVLKYLDNKDMNIREKIYYLYLEMERMEGKVGSRYRRKTAEYLFIKILENKYCKEDDINKVIFNFMLKCYNKKKTEKKAFGVWLGMLYLFDDKSDNLDIKSIDFKSIEMSENECYKYLIKDRERKEINEDFVVKDYHVNKKFGLKKFGSVGAYVVNEDLSLLGENGKKYVEYYKFIKERNEKLRVESLMLKKNKVEKNSKKKEEIEKPIMIKTNVRVIEKDGKRIFLKRKLKGKNKVEVKTEIEKKQVTIDKSGEKVNIVKDFNKKYDVLKILDEGVCSMKKPCILIKDKKNDKKYVIKSMSKTLNYGKDYAVIDEIRGELGLLRSNIFRIGTDIKMELKNKDIRNYNKNCKIVKTEKCDNIYCVMDYFDNIGDLGKHKDKLENDETKRALLKIRIGVGLFRVSDNILRNVLINDKNELLSIDDNDIYGKRKLIFNKMDWCKKNEWCRDNYRSVVEEIKMLLNKEKCINIIKKYKFKNEDDIICEFIERYDNFEDIVSSEFE